MFTPRFWKSLKFDGLIQTYQRGHKAVMNVHSVGGNSENTRYVGMDEFGNKYYECFDAERTFCVIKTTINAGGLSTTTTSQSEAPMETEFPPNGMAGSTTCMMTNPSQIATHSMIHFSRSPTNGNNQLQPSDFTFQKAPRFIPSFCNTGSTDKTSLLLNGLQ